jgi:hypothetical protein
MIPPDGYTLVDVLIELGEIRKGVLTRWDYLVHALNEHPEHWIPYDIMELPEFQKFRTELNSHSRYPYSLEAKRDFTNGLVVVRAHYTERREDTIKYPPIERPTIEDWEARPTDYFPSLPVVEPPEEDN